MAINVLCLICVGSGKTGITNTMCSFCSGGGMLQIQCHTDGCEANAVVIVSPGVAPLTVNGAYCKECCRKFSLCGFHCVLLGDGTNHLLGESFRNCESKEERPHPTAKRMKIATSLASLIGQRYHVNARRTYSIKG